MGRLGQKVALVTGGASGIGIAIAKRLAADGTLVVIGDVQRDLGLATAKEYGLTFLEQDVCEEARWGEIVVEVEKSFGQLNILVNNAGVLGPIDAASPENTSLPNWRTIFAVNVESVFLGCRAVIPVMRRAGSGSIINMSSSAGLASSPSATAYGASKAAVTQLTKSVAQYCAEQKANIRCNSVHPGPVLTPLWMKYAHDSARSRAIAVETVVEEGRGTIPLGRFVTSEDVAAAVSFLASPDASNITGMEMIVDGGLTHCRA